VWGWSRGERLGARRTAGLPRRRWPVAVGGVVEEVGGGFGDDGPASWRRRDGVAVRGGKGDGI